MAGTLKRIAGPAFIASAAANVYTPPAATIYTVIRHIHVANVTAGAVSFSAYVGATGGSAGGTELFKGHSVPANSEFDYWCNLKMISTDFLSALDGNGAALVITVEGEQVVV